MRKLATMVAVLLTAVVAIAAQCEGITKKGSQCKRQASPGSQYCWQHGGSVKNNAAATSEYRGQCDAITKGGKRCTRKAQPGGTKCWQHAN